MSTTIEMNEDELQDVVISLGVRMSFMETGTSHLRANDAIQQGQHKLVQPLSDGQKAIILRMEKLRTTLQKEQAQQRYLPKGK